jgi:peptidyl-tRNA hydrolase
VAAKLRRDLGIEVEMEHGSYGEYKVLVDGQTVIDGGALTALGIVPARRKVIETVRARLLP